MNHNRIVINHVTYEVHRVYSGGNSIASLLKDRLRKEFPVSSPLTGQGGGKYNDGSGSILSEEVL